MSSNSSQDLGLGSSLCEVVGMPGFSDTHHCAALAFRHTLKQGNDIRVLQSFINGPLEIT